MQIACIFLAILPLFAPSNAEARPIIVELFTSQGCSSCPPADAFLAELRQNSDLLPLSFHVDYWNNKDWTDEFSLKAATDRERVYSRNFGSESLFTPMMVVDGLGNAVGSDKKAVNHLIDKAKMDAANVPVVITPDLANNKLLVHIPGKDEGFDVATLPHHADILVVTYNNGFVTPISGGENTGRDVQNYNIVRHISTLGSWNQRSFYGEIPLKENKTDNLAVILQSEYEGRILGASIYKFR